MATQRKQPAERIIEALTWASVVIWLGFTLIAHILNYVWLVVLVLSVIFLSSAIYQRSRNWETSLSIWVFGIWMAVFSVLEFVNEMIKLLNEGAGLNIDLWVYLGVALVSMGVATVFKMINPSAVVGSNSARRPSDYDPERDYAPRRVDQTLNRAAMPPAQDAAYYGSGRRGEGSPPDFGPAYDTAQGDYGTYRDPRRPPDQGYYNEPLPRQPADTGYYNEPPPRDPRQRAGTGYADTGYYEEPPPRDPRRARPADNTGWGTSSYARQTQERPYTGERLSRQRGRGRSQPQRSPQRQPPRQPPRQPQSTDLESRVEDIIRRSRSQRSDMINNDEDLPY